MKISFPSNPITTCTFKELDPGDVFQAVHTVELSYRTAHIMVKLSELPKSDVSRHKHFITYNAIYLEGGVLMDINDEEVVVYYGDANLQLGEPTP